MSNRMYFIIQTFKGLYSVIQKFERLLVSEYVLFCFVLFCFVFSNEQMWFVTSKYDKWAFMEVFCHIGTNMVLCIKVSI